MKLFLAPMADISDLPFREICYDAGADFCYSEMISTKALIMKNQKTLELAKISNKEKKTFIQLFGSNPEDFPKALEIVQEFSSPYGFDVNMGCPVKKVIKTGAGSALLENPKTVEKIVRNLRKATTKPLSVKIRAGFNKENWQEISKIIEGEGADILVVHPRLQTQMFEGKSNFEISLKIAENLKIKTVHSGDINSFKDAAFFENSHLFGLMSGRGVLGNPTLFKELKEKKSVNENTKLEFLKLHLNRIIDFFPQKKAQTYLKKHSAWYSKGKKGASKFRESIFTQNDTFEDTLNKINDFFEIKL